MRERWPGIGVTELYAVFTPPICTLDRPHHACSWGRLATRRAVNLRQHRSLYISTGGDVLNVLQMGRQWLVARPPLSRANSAANAAICAWYWRVRAITVPSRFLRSSAFIDCAAARVCSARRARRCSTVSVSLTRRGA